MRRLTALACGTLLTAAALAACGDDAASGEVNTEAYCGRLQSYKERGDALDAVFAVAEPSTADIEEAFTSMQSMSHDLQNGAPAELQDDVDTMAEGIDTVVGLFAQYDWDLQALYASTDMATLQNEMRGTDMQAARDNLDAFASNHCTTEQGS